MLGLFLLFWTLLLLLSLLSFDANDPSLNHAILNQAGVRNKAGLFGAYVAGFLNDLFGIGACVWPVFFGILGVICITPLFVLHMSRLCGLFLLALVLLVAGEAWTFALGDLTGGGMIGKILYQSTTHYFSPFGSFLMWLFLALFSLQLIYKISLFTFFARVKIFLQQCLAVLQKKNNTPLSWQYFGIKKLSLQKFRELFITKFQKHTVVVNNTKPEQQHKKKITHSIQKNKQTLPDEDFFQASEKILPIALSEDTDVDFTNLTTEKKEQQTTLQIPKNNLITTTQTQQKEKKQKTPKISHEYQHNAVSLPSLDLLNPPEHQNENEHLENYEQKGQILMDSLKDFDIAGELVHIIPGPVVTMFELRPAPGIRISKIANLNTDLARTLKAKAVRIQAPVPGTDMVGVEIPNETRKTVNFRELANSESFQRGCGPLTMILGKDIAGRPFLADLARMPHMLVAGATGAGKSVCLNCILASFLYRTQPSDLRLLLIDPKRIELAIYADEPHLIHPVVTEMSDAKNALAWATHEMDERYKAFVSLKVRNIEGYNKKIKDGQNLPDELADATPLPYLAIIIDELADLMMTASKDVEGSIVRLAQLARAAGIHMILATQRPSVDVVTGLIKANFPCRISFQVASRHDSRTILDQDGAEQLLGRGDMLFKAGSGIIQRLHGPYLSEDEVQRIVCYWKNQLETSYKVDFSQWKNDSKALGSTEDSNADDVLYGEVRTFVCEQGRASISQIQRRFKIGFNRAARLVEQLEYDGIIGPADGSKPRLVLNSIR